ncbi:NAD(P)H-hydrate dehydratase [Sphingobacterium thalpophilum]|uniref:NAD(P)H-hydrate dehydratase n=1 Tax=Sphingobacterium thalpophilum TaxID=259 RepID=UPI003DA519AA
MKIVSALQMDKIDSETIKEQQISSIELMERAATAVFEQLRNSYPRLDQQAFYIFCGKGNNGGDGLVLARLLEQQQAEVHVYLLDAETYSSDNRVNRERLPDYLIRTVKPEDRLDIPKNGIVLDCLFGYGLRRPLAVTWANLIGSINHSGAYVYSIDMPSGLLADSHTEPEVPVVQADWVYTFQSPKLALLMPENQPYVKGFSVLNIGLSERAIGQSVTPYFYVDGPLLHSFYRKRQRFGHKGTFGHILIIGGSKGKMGAVQLALKAALRAGCGLATAYIPACGYSIVQTAIPEVMVLNDNEEQLIAQFPQLAPYQAVGIGIGMGTGQQTVDAFRVFLSRRINTPLVLDADALNILAKDSALWSFVPKHSILTPHPKELSRILGPWQTDFEKLERVKAFAAQYQLYILVKGANSAMVTPGGEVYFNSTGNVGMASGGSGDVLTGILTALLGQGYSPLEALLMGVYVHGRAADIAVRSIGTYSLLPSDTIDALASAFLELEQR